MAVSVWFSACLVVMHSAPISANKRLVLHSNLDVSSAFGIFDKNLTEFEKRILQVESRIGQLETENKFLATVNLQLQTENKDLKTKVTLLENSTQQLTSVNLQLKTEYKGLKTKVTVLENTTQHLASVNLQLKTEYKGLETKATVLENTTQHLTAQLKMDNLNGGATFVRWGRTTCPGNDTSFVYQGYIGGSLYSDKGGGSNSLCLPFVPTWNAYVDGVSGAKSTIYGGEIEVETGFSTKAFGYNYHDEDPPCATCLTSREAVVMIPGRSNCYPGWTMEYTGYLVGGRSSHSSSDYICLDSHPESVPSGLSSSSNNQHILYFTEAHCGSLPCPPYHDGRELACVVCSK